MRSLNIKYIPELDQLRGIAAVLVVYFHAVNGPYLGTQPNGLPVVDSLLKLFIANGHTGVALFFVISGFLFTWGALHWDVFDWKKFYINRGLRIFPMYVLVLLVAFSLTRGNFSFGLLLQDLVGFGNFSNPVGQFDIVLWTISVELQFYMIFPFLLHALRKGGARYIYGLIGVMLLLRLFVFMGGMSLHDPIYYTLLGRLDEFLIGMVLAWHVRQKGWLSPGRAVSFHTPKLLAGMAGTLAVMLGLLWVYTSLGWRYGESGFNVIWPTLEGAMWAAFGVFYVGLAIRHHSRVFKAIQFVGMISFSLYLLHLPIINALDKSKLVLSIPGQAMASGLAFATFEVLPIAILVSLLTYYVVEKPPLEMRRRYATFAAPAVTAPASEPVPLVSGSDA